MNPQNKQEFIPLKRKDTPARLPIRKAMNIAYAQDEKTMLKAKARAWRGSLVIEERNKYRGVFSPLGIEVTDVTTKGTTRKIKAEILKKYRQKETLPKEQQEWIEKYVIDLPLDVRMIFR